MPSYKVEIKKSAVKEIESLGKKIIPTIWQKIESLARNPRPPACQKLTGSKKSYRLRVASFRILYQVDDRSRIVTVYSVGHRREVYRS
jgi:mRNA interferase RelE/StbE